MSFTVPGIKYLQKKYLLVPGIIKYLQNKYLLVPGNKYLQNKYLQEVLIRKYLRRVSWAPGELLATSCNQTNDDAEDSDEEEIIATACDKD